MVEYRCSTLLRDNDLGQLVGSRGGRHDAGIGGCLNSASLFLPFRGLQPGIRRNSFYGKHLYVVVREAEIPPQLSATQGFRVILAN